MLFLMFRIFLIVLSTLQCALSDTVYHRHSFLHPILSDESTTNNHFNNIHASKLRDVMIVADASSYKTPKQSSVRNIWSNDRSGASKSYTTESYDTVTSTTTTQRTMKDFSTRDSRIGFIRKVYAIFTTQMAATICIVYMILMNPGLQRFLIVNSIGVALGSFITSLSVLGDDDGHCVDVVLHCIFLIL